MNVENVSKWVAIIAAILSLAVGNGWFQQYQKAQKADREATDQLIIDYLQPINTKLKDNRAIFDELYKDHIEDGRGILESYLFMARRDGVKKHSLMRNQIETLVQNNNTIVVLLEKYAGHIKTQQFKEQSQLFRDHAILYNNRWRSMLELMETNDQLPVAPVFPIDFPVTVEKEIDAQKKIQS